MSIKVMTHVWDYSKQEGTKLLLLLALADFARDDGRAWPSVETLAKKARCGKRNAQYILRELAEIGEIEVKKRAGPKGTNLYTILVGVQPIAPPISRQVQSSVKGGAIQRTEKVQPIAPDPLLTVKEPLKDSRTDVRGGNSKIPKNEKDRIRKQAVEYFSEQTKIPLPAMNTDGQRKAAGKLWFGPIREICDLVEWDEFRARQLIQTALERLDGLTITDPNSILKTCRGIYGENTRSGYREKRVSEMSGDEWKEYLKSNV